MLPCWPQVVENVQQKHSETELQLHVERTPNYKGTQPTMSLRTRHNRQQNKPKEHANVERRDRLPGPGDGCQQNRDLCRSYSHGI